MKKSYFVFLLTLIGMVQCFALGTLKSDFTDGHYDCRILPDKQSVAITYSPSWIYPNERIIPQTVTNPSDNKTYLVTVLDSNAFNERNYEFTMVIGDNITEILYDCFYASALTEVTIGKNVRRIENGAFQAKTTNSSTYKLKVINLKGKTPPTLCKTAVGQTVFNFIYQYATFNVPCGTIDAYKQDPTWKDELSSSKLANVKFVEVVPALDIKCDETQGSINVIKYNTCEDHDITFEVVPIDERYTFTGWSDGITMNPRTITLTEDGTLSAFFTTKQYTLTLSCDETQGSVTGDGTYDYNTEVPISATPKEGYEFVQWSDGVTTSERMVTITGDMSLTASFRKKQCVVSLSCNTTQGSVTGDGTYDYNTEVPISATPKEGYVFEKWSDDVTTNPRTIIVREAVNLTALFKVKKYTLQLTCDETQGTVVGSGEHDYGERVSIVAYPKTLYEFDRWSDGDTQNPRTISVTGDISLEAIFRMKGTPTPVITIDDDVFEKSKKKILRDGQMIIIGTDGHEYKVTGEMIK